MRKIIFIFLAFLFLTNASNAKVASDQIEKDKKNSIYNGKQPLSISVLFRLIEIFPCK